jgi:hypothetical protein
MNQRSLSDITPFRLGLESQLIDHFRPLFKDTGAFSVPSLA